MKTIFRNVAIVIASGLVIFLTVEYITDRFFSPDNASPPNISLEFTAPSDLNYWTPFVDALGDAVKPPAHGATTQITDGALNLSISPDSNFAHESAEWKAGQAAAEQYNNIFLVGLRGYTPTNTRRVFVEWRMSISPDYQGTTGVWLEDQRTFEPNGHVADPVFPGAFNLSWTSKESISQVSGLKFMYVIGYAPICVLDVPNVDPTKWVIYRMEWEKGGIYSAYVNGTKIGTCNIPIVEFHNSEIQLWADNYKIDPGLQINYQNPSQVQSVSYDWIRIGTEPVR